MFDLLPHLLNGLTLGLLFALIALGFMLIVGLMEQINLAHGSLFALGAYFAMQLMGSRPPFPAELAKAWLALPLGWRYAATLVIAPAAVGIVGIAIEFCMRRTYGKDPLYGLLLTFGAAMVIEETIRLVWGTRDYVLQVPQAVSGGFLFGDLIWSTYRFYAAGISVAIIGVVWLVIEKTSFGATVKAGAHDSEIVRALGINLTRLAAPGVRARHHAGRDRRHHRGADLGHPSAYGRRCRDPGVSGHRARRRRQLLGRRRGRPSGRALRRPIRRLCVGMVAAVDVHPAGRGGDRPRPRPVGQEKRARSMTATPPPSSDATRLVTPAMLVLWLVLATVPLWIARVGLYPYLGIEILIWSLYALAFNLVLGTAGLPSFGHGAYFGIGAYAFGLCQFNVVANLWVCLAAAFAVAGLAGALVALFISHRRGIYYAFMTIAFGQIFWTLAIKSHGITGGEDGLLKIARLPADFGVAKFDLIDNVAFYYFVLALFALAVVAMWRLTHSPYGRVVAAIKQSETRAAHLGYNVWLYKASIFTLSAAISGLAGGLFAMAQLAAFPDVMSLHQSGYVVMMTLVGGGLVSFWGPVVGVFVFLIARDVIGALTNAWMLYFGLSVHRHRAVPARGHRRRGHAPRSRSIR